MAYGRDSVKNKRKEKLFQLIDVKVTFSQTMVSHTSIKIINISSGTSDIAVVHGIYFLRCWHNNKHSQRNIPIEFASNLPGFTGETKQLRMLRCKIYLV